jgi:hypothetical protein
MLGITKKVARDEGDPMLSKFIISSILSINKSMMNLTMSLVLGRKRRAPFTSKYRNCSKYVFGA